MNQTAKLLKVGIVLLLLVGGGLVIVPRVLMSRAKPVVVLSGDSEDRPVTAEIPLPYAVVRYRLESIFNADPVVVGEQVNKFDKESKWHAYHLVSNEGGQGIDSLFTEPVREGPEEEPSLSLGFRNPEQTDSALEPYLSQPAERRRSDFLLMLTPFRVPEFWWTSLYQFNGVSVPYRTHYILSLTPLNGATTTKLEVIALDSEVEAGYEYRYPEGDGPRLFPIKAPARILVKPVIKDKEETLEVIVEAIKTSKSDPR